VLVLTRRANQSIMIGADIVVTVLDVKGDQVRIGVQAPRSVTVHREEVVAELARANRDAATSARGGVDALSRAYPASRRQTGPSKDTT
jgi:carbon storage regulator